MKHDNQNHMIVFALACAAALFLLDCGREIWQTVLYRYLQTYLNSLIYTLHLDGDLNTVILMPHISVSAILSSLREYLTGAGIFLICRSVTLGRKNLRHTEAMILGICMTVIPNAVAIILPILYRLNTLF